MISSIILAAGSSNRMGSPKALLKIGKETFLQHIVYTLSEHSISHIVIVLGAHADEIRPSIVHLPVHVAINARWQSGQLSSLIVGLDALPEAQTAGVLVWPVDHPLVSPVAVDALINAFSNDSRKIIIPKYQGKRGHPVIFPNSLFNELRSAHPDKGARSVVHRHEPLIYEVEAGEEGILINIDTPEDYSRYIESRYN